MVQQRRFLKPRWDCDGGTADILPVRPLLDIRTPPDVVVAINGFRPKEFDGEDITGCSSTAISQPRVASPQGAWTGGCRWLHGSARS